VDSQGSWSFAGPGAAKWFVCGGCAWLHEQQCLAEAPPSWSRSNTVLLAGPLPHNDDCLVPLAQAAAQAVATQGT